MRLYKKLGISNAVAVIGGSMGGMQALVIRLNIQLLQKILLHWQQLHIQDLGQLLLIKLE